jgi:copper(I)-binding protein
MKKGLGTIVLLGALILSACGGSHGEIEVHEPWARTAAQGGTSAVYFEIHNHSETADEMLSASSDVADAVELHLSSIDENGVMQMKQQASIPLGPDEELMFAPGGLHIMLIGLKQDLIAGETFEVTLHFKNREDLVITVTVLDEDGGGEMHDMATPTP